MLFRSLAVGASLALAANGVLIPSGLALHEGPADKLGFPYAVNQAMNVIVECQKCLFAEEVGDVMVWKSGVKNVLVYRFDVGPQRDRLALGGVQLYPPVYGEPSPIYVQQLPAKNGFEFSQSHPDRQGLRVTQMEFYFNNAETISEDGNEILTMHLEIFGVANKLIGPHVIGIKVLKDTAGNLHLLATKVLTDPTAIAADEAKQCASWPMVCKFRQFIAEKMAMLRQSMKKPGKGGCQKSNPAADRIDWRPHHRPGRPGRPHHPEEPHHKPHHPPHNRPHHHHEHHGHHRHHHHSTIHRVLHIFVRVVVTFVVPILIGIAAGVATYMAGMLIGMIVAFIWVKIRGERPSQYESITQFDDDEADEDASMVKQVYFDEPVEVEGEEAPPVYQEKEVVN